MHLPSAHSGRPGGHWAAVLLLLMLNSLFSPASSQRSAAAQPAPPAAVSPIVPAFLGTWQAGQVFGLDAAGHLRVDHTPVDPDLSDRTLVPYGQRVEFTNGYDKASDVAYWQVLWLPPFTAAACQYPSFSYRCTVEKGHVDQETWQLELGLGIKKEETAELFAPVGATKDEVWYLIRGGANDEWLGDLYVSRDRQRMWCIVSITPLITRPDGTRYMGHSARGWQEYHRLAPFKRHGAGR